MSEYTLHHEDCKFIIVNGICPKCGFPPDMQSTYLQKKSIGRRAAEEIRKLDFTTASVMMTLFDTGQQDKDECEEIILQKMTAIIDEEIAKERA